MPLTAAQWRMARAALDWTVKQLADHANVGTSMVKRLELGEPVVPWMVRDVRAALEAAGVEFTADAWGVGARMRRQS